MALRNVASGINQEEKANFSDIYDNIPNPFIDETEIRFSLNQPALIKLIITDVFGNHIVNLIDGFVIEGDHTVKFKTSEYNLPSGIYFYTLSSNGITKTKAMVLIK